MKRLTLLVSLTFLFCLTASVSAFGYNDASGPILTPEPTGSINGSALEVNNSQYLQGYTPLTLRSWMQITFDTLYCKLTGCTMAGDINMGSNDISNVNDIYTDNVWATHVNGTTGNFTDLYVSNNTLYIGDSIRLSANGQNGGEVLNVTGGNLSAEYFYGSGAFLTDIDWSQIDFTNLTFDGDTINASFFNGDNFTGANYFGGNFYGWFNWSAEGSYLDFDGYSLTLNESLLNETFSINDTLLNETYVNSDGDTMTGDLNMSGNNITDVNNLVFNLGEYLTNIIDGWISVVGSMLINGDLNVTGNVNLGGGIVTDNGTALLNLPHGELEYFLEDEDSIPLNISNVQAGVLYTLGGLEGEELRGFNFTTYGTNSTLVPLQSGTYQMSADGTFFIEPTQRLDIAVYVNGVKIPESSKDVSGVEADDVFPYEISINTGTNLSGGVGDLKFKDAREWNLKEDNGAPGFDFNISFNKSDTLCGCIPKFLEVDYRYQGSDSHDVLIYMWNWTLGDWYKIDSRDDDLFHTDRLYQSFSFELPNDLNNLASATTGEMKFRILHPNAGSTSHDLYLDKFLLKDRNAIVSASKVDLIELVVGDNITLGGIFQDDADIVFIEEIEVIFVRVGDIL